MEEAPLDPLIAFSWLATELLGRAVSACIQPSSASAGANQAYRKVTLELAQSSQRPGQLMLKGARLQTFFNPEDVFSVRQGK
jgi:hypothetical protein